MDLIGVLQVVTSFCITRTEKLTLLCKLKHRCQDCSCDFDLHPYHDETESNRSHSSGSVRELAGGTIYHSNDAESYVNGVVRILNADYYLEQEHEGVLVPLDTYSSTFIDRCILNKNRGFDLPHPWKYL
ncbi:unnamed protein product [Orchesella dallaii]|uniref:Uncharacterized protein n=1 Tax=Orchesella dallaii TaxID=48710 RepID=A0ABP1R1M4_9HEXA